MSYAAVCFVIAVLAVVLGYATTIAAALAGLVVVDDKLVTSRKPDDLPAFNGATIELFAHHRQSG